MKRLLYTTRSSLALSQFVAGVGVRNPEYYSKPESDVQEVGIEGDYPQIADDYERLGVKVIMAPFNTSGDSVGIEGAAGGKPTQNEVKKVAPAPADADERKLLIATLKAKGIKHAKNASTDQLRALAQSASTGLQEDPANA